MLVQTNMAFFPWGELRLSNSLRPSRAHHFHGMEDSNLLFINGNLAG